MIKFETHQNFSYSFATVHHNSVAGISYPFFSVTAANPFYRQFEEIPASFIFSGQIGIKNFLIYENIPIFHSCSKMQIQFTNNRF
jgi:hypothetical protein